MVAQATPAFPQTAENLEGELAGADLEVYATLAGGAGATWFGYEKGYCDSDGPGSYGIKYHPDLGRLRP